MLLDAAFALVWCSRYEPWERRRSSDRLGVWAVRALIPLGQLTILAGTIATAAGPHAGRARRASSSSASPSRARDTLRMGGRAPRGRSPRCLRLRRDRRLVPPAPPGRRPARDQAAHRDDRPARRSRASLGNVQWALKLPSRARLGPRRPRDAQLAGDAVDDRGRGPARAAVGHRRAGRRLGAGARRRQRRAADPATPILPFWLSIGFLSLVQGLLVAAPRPVAHSPPRPLPATGGRWCCRFRSSS